MAEDTKEAKSHHLPDDLVREILLRLPAKSIVRFQCVSKSWLSITTKRSFLRNHSRRSPNSLLIHTTKHHSNDSNLLDFNIHLLPRAASRVLFERRRSTTDVVFASCDGLLCFREPLDEERIPCYYVLNPLTRSEIVVPKPTCSRGHLMGLYYHQSTCEYRLIRRIKSNSNFDKVELLTLGGEAWRTIDASLLKASVCAPTPIDLNGSLYWNTYDKKPEFRFSGVLRFDIMKEEFELMPLPPGVIDLVADRSLIDMGERLGLLVIDRNRKRSSVYDLGIDVWVVKDYENVEWEKMYSLSCSGGLDRIDFGSDYCVDDIALCFRKEEIVVLFVGPRSYLVQFDLNSSKYCTQQVLDPEDFITHYSLLYKESLVSLLTDEQTTR